MKDQKSVQGSYLELSESRNSLELTNLVCFYNSPNLNGLQLDYGETDEEHEAALGKAQTLIDMPVYAFCTVNKKQEPTFSGHEATQKPDGTYEFKTTPIGVHTAVAIEEREVTLADGSGTAVLPCLIAHQRIWKRNKNAVAAIRRLFAENALHNSYELDVREYHFADGIRHALDYEFMGNAFLASDSIGRGKAVQPAYGPSASVLSVAQVDVGERELMFAEALAMDMQEQTGNEVENLENEEMLNEQEQVEQAEVVEQEQEPVEEVAEEEQQPEEQEPETAETEEVEEVQPVVAEEEQEEIAALTMCDLIVKIEQLARENVGGDGHIAFVFPEEHVAWYHKWHSLETQFTQIEYEVAGNDVRLVKTEEVQIELPVNQLQAQYVAQKQENAEMKEQIAELSEYKSKYEAAEAEKAAKEHAEKVGALKKMAEDSGCFTAEELSEQSMTDLFDGLKELEVKAMIADKLMKKAAPVHVESAEVQPSRNLLDTEEVTVDRISVMRRWLSH